MSRLQRVIILVATLLIVGSAAFPPWQSFLFYGVATEHPKYIFIGSPPPDDAESGKVFRIDVTRLLLQWLFIVLLALGLYLAAAKLDEKRTASKSDMNPTTRE